MPLFTIHHATVYRYRQPVLFGPHSMMFRPQESHDQEVLERELRIGPEPVSLRSSRDVFGNAIDVARFAERGKELRFENFLRVSQTEWAPEASRIEGFAQTLPFSFPIGDAPDLAGYLEPAHADPGGEVAAFARQFLLRGKPTPTLGLLAALTREIRAAFEYVRREEKGIQEPAETLQRRAGSCRDFALLMIEAARSLGMPARFVSGYLYVPSRDTFGLHGGGSTHAWAQVFLPGIGWADFDPTNAIVGNRGLIRVAFAREPRQALPLSGSFTGFPSDDLGMEVTVRVGCESRDVGDQRSTVEFG